MDRQRDRAVSPAVGTVLLLAVVVGLGAGTLAAVTAVGTPAPAPTVVAGAEELRAACAGCGPADQVIRLTHRHGDPVRMSETELVVESPGGSERARLTDLPLETNCLGDDHVEGADLFDGRCGRVGGSLTAVGPDADGVWRAGEVLVVRVRKSAVRLEAGEELTVRVLDEASGAVVCERTLSAVGR